ncbi:GyrI-like domain-containing protein [Methylocella sp.]|jgi:effector-binding domain-containing protein|uniref:GyrI-like domain-containing protein n=1 Tax=Methylocella sp. TaxID=1978226 RepID=UPI003C17D341
MRFDDIRRSTALSVALGFVFCLFASLPMAALAEDAGPAAPSAETAPAPPAPPASHQAAPAPDQGAPAPEATVPEPDHDKAAPGIPSDASAETVDVPARPVALVAGDAQWADGFKAIVAAIEKVQDAVKTAGLQQAGPPFAVFLSTDETSFHYEAMVPLAEKPEGKSDLSDTVKIGDSPSGKAIKFLHRGAYDDIDSTYDLITAYLDEKGLEAKNLFIEEYLSDTKESDDATLQADIYVFLK